MPDNEDEDDIDLCSIRVTFPFIEGRTLAEVGSMLSRIGAAMQDLGEERTTKIGRGVHLVAVSEQGMALPIKVVANTLAPHIVVRMAAEAKAVKEMFGGQHES